MAAEILGLNQLLVKAGCAALVLVRLRYWLSESEGPSDWEGEQCFKGFISFSQSSSDGGRLS